MSVGIAIRYNNRIIMACDRQQSTGDYKCLINDKMLCNDDFVIVMAGRIRAIQVFKNEVFPKLNKENFSREYLETEFADELFRVFKDKNILEKTNDEDYLPIGLIIANNKGECYKIFTDGTVNPLVNYLAIGSGEHEAEAILSYCFETYNDCSWLCDFTIEKVIKAISEINSTISAESLVKVISIDQRGMGI